MKLQFTTSIKLHNNLSSNKNCTKINVNQQSLTFSKYILMASDIKIASKVKKKNTSNTVNNKKMKSKSLEG